MRPNTGLLPSSEQMPYQPRSREVDVICLVSPQARRQVTNNALDQHADDNIAKTYRVRIPSTIQGGKLK